MSIELYDTLAALELETPGRRGGRGGGGFPFLGYYIPEAGYYGNTRPFETGLHACAVETSSQSDSM